MNADLLMDALGKVKDDYILEACPKQKQATRPPFRWIAAAIAVVMLLTFFQTAPGAHALEVAKEVITNFLEEFFPPKDIPVYVEGETEVVTQEAAGQEPEILEDGTVIAPGFGIYYDPELYTMIEDSGVTFIRFNIENELPPCELEIRHIPGVAPVDAAESVRNEMTENWELVSEIRSLEDMDGLYLHISAGTNWNSPCEDIYFLSNGRDGSFQITARYFVEATEGHGVRFGQMVRTFEIIDP